MQEKKWTPVYCQPGDDSDCENEPLSSQLAKKKGIGQFDENDTDSTDILSSTSQSSLSAPDDEGILYSQLNSSMLQFMWHNLNILDSKEIQYLGNAWLESNLR